MQQNPLLQTKPYIPPIRPEVVSRPSLIERLNAGLRLGRELTLISASAGFGKTTLLSEWVAGCGRREPKVRPAWLALDHPLSDVSSCCVADDCRQYWKTGVGYSRYGSL